MKFKINEASDNDRLLLLGKKISDVILKNGNLFVPQNEISNFVLNLIDLDSPRSFRRKSQEEMVISIAITDNPPDDLKTACYTALIKSISNMLFCISLTGSNDHIRACSITPEAGFVEFDYEPELIYKYMYPVVNSHFVLKNRLSQNIHISENSVEVEDLKSFGRELHGLGVLPSPFPLSDYLSKDLIAQLYRLYKVKGLSYGNLSIRAMHDKADGTSFWMTARGVDKSKLQGLGKDILLVNGYDSFTGEMLVSVPGEYDPRIRASVDAIEHYLIYEEFPEVGAIVHVHAWIENVLCTTQVYPCGTRELAENVVDLLRKTSTPERTEVGLKNHGLTITGHDFTDIFSRIHGRLKTNVPMMI